MNDSDETAVQAEGPPGLLDRLLRPFGDVRAGESITVLLMFANIFAILVGYYVLKTIREPLILNTGGAEVKAYSSAGQAILLMGFIPLYSWFASRVDRMRLIVGFNVFFFVCIQLFFFAGRAEVPYTGIAFFIWMGIFNNAVVAQFWSYANDIYSRSAGERLFPLIVIGMTAGTPVGSKLAEVLFERGMDPFTMMQLGAASLAVSLLLYWIVNGRQERVRTGPAEAAGSLAGAGGFGLILRSRYLQLIALTLILANLVNTTGEYILGSLVVEQAKLLPELERDQFVGAFYGNFFFWVNIATTLIQAFLVSRIVKRFGIAGVVLALPLVALGTYGLVAAGAGFAVTRWAKTAENSTDYSIMNTAKAMLWLPTSREEKYKAKQAVDTFFVRVGDLMSAGLVAAGTQVLALGVTGFAVANVGIVGVWLFVARRLLRCNKELVAQQPADAA